MLWKLLRRSNSFLNFRRLLRQSPFLRKKQDMVIINKKNSLKM